MKFKKIIILAIVVLLIVAITVAGFVLAESGANKSFEERDRTNILLVPEQVKETGDYTGVVDVYLEMDDGMILGEDEATGQVQIKDAASVASFQLALDIDVGINDNDIKSKVDFEFDKDLQNKEETKLVTYNESPKTETNYTQDGSVETKTVGEKLYIYYVGTKELNDIKSTEPLKVGTIKLDKSKLENNTTVLITPDSEISTAASIGHTETAIDIQPEDRVQLLVNHADSEQDPEKDPEKDPEQDPEKDSEKNPQKNPSDGENSDEYKNGWASDDDKTDDESILDKIFSPKTGANRSLIWVIVSVVVLVIIATGIIVLKSKNKQKKSKH